MSAPSERKQQGEPKGILVAPGFTTLTQNKDKGPVTCPMCNNEMTYIQACHLKCMVCGAELSCEDKGWFWG